MLWYIYTLFHHYLAVVPICIDFSICSYVDNYPYGLLIIATTSYSYFFFMCNSQTRIRSPNLRTWSEKQLFSASWNNQKFVKCMVLSPSVLQHVTGMHCVVRKWVLSFRSHIILTAIWGHSVALLARIWALTAVLWPHSSPRNDIPPVSLSSLRGLGGYGVLRFVLGNIAECRLICTRWLVFDEKLNETSM